MIDLLFVTLAQAIANDLNGVNLIVEVAAILYLAFFMLWLIFGEALMMLLKRSRWFRWNG